jgi:hypothetical protein
MLAHRTKWSDRRVIDVLQIEHPIVLSPMAGIGTVDLARSRFCRWRPRFDRLRRDGTRVRNQDNPRAARTD